MQKTIETKYEWYKNENYVCSTCHNKLRKKYPLSSSL